MSQKEKLIIYPYDRELAPVIRNRELLSDYEIAEVVAPNGWCFSGKDAGVADNGGLTGISVGSDFDHALNGGDTVWFCDSENRLDFGEMIYPKVKKAIAAGKNVISSLSVEKDFRDEVSGLCQGNGLYFKDFGQPVNDRETASRMTPEEEWLYPMETPVIFVEGLAEKTNKFQIQLDLRRELSRLGYRICQVGTRNYCEMLGFHSFPSFMYRSIPESNKVVMFNHFIKQLEQTERPDVILIGVPGGIMPFNRNFSNRFGILAFEIGQAIQPDAVIFSVLYDEYPVEYFGDLGKSVRYKLGHEVDCFNLANVKFDWNNARNEQKLLYVTLDSDFVEGRINKYANVGTPIFNIFEAGAPKNMTHYLLSKLMDYAEVQLV